LTLLPPAQLFQTLLRDLEGAGSEALVVVFVRFEDLLGGGAGGPSPWLSAADRAAMGDRADELTRAIVQCVAQNQASFLVIVTRPGAAVDEVAEAAAHHARLENMLEQGLAGHGRVEIVRWAELEATYPVPQWSDPFSEEIAEIPYTAHYYAALATRTARWMHGLFAAPRKVLALDCDNTLWGGICAEDGDAGIVIDEPRIALQRFVLGLRERGMLLCLCSKNQEDDVLRLLDGHDAMLLKRQHFAGLRINWLPKSDNLRSLAEELGLGLESFVFLDDNPVEIAEVAARAPEVLAIALPTDLARVPQWLRQHWAFDQARPTAEAARRALLYRDEAMRQSARAVAPSFEAFIESLELRIDIAPMTTHQVARVAELSQRTNQFNATGLRRTAAEVEQAAASGLEIRVTHVRDRFGSYGDVGVVAFWQSGQALRIDTFFLSCRALGRGVEHRMMTDLLEIASSRGCGEVEVPFRSSPRNQPARSFLESFGAAPREEADGLVFRISTGHDGSVEDSRSRTTCQP
jgi:FkbH-like protein